MDKTIAQLRRTSRTPANPTIAIGAALAAGITLLNHQGTCWKRTLDISGDGKSNTGPHPRNISHSAHTTEITINALVVGVDSQQNNGRRHIKISELSSFFTPYVIAGPDAFVETALGFDNFGAAMIRNLKRELQGLALSNLKNPVVQ